VWINNTENNYNQSSKEKRQMKTKLSILGEKLTKYATELWHSHHCAIFFFLMKEI
jgi:hypothetical protein